MQLAVDDDREQAVLQRVAAEDVAEAGRDDRADAPGGSAQGACSRDEPEPKLSPGEEDLPALHLRAVEDEVRVRACRPRGSASRGRGRAARPVFSVVFRYRAGMIWSVSTFSFGSGIDPAGEGRERLGHVSVLPWRPARARPHVRPRVGDDPGDGGRRGGQRRREERPAALALPALEVAVARADARTGPARAGRRSWRCTCEQPASRQSAPAARNTSWRPSASAWRLTCLRPRDDEDADAVGDPPAAEHGRRRPQVARCAPLVHEPMNTASSRWPAMRLPGRRPMYPSAFSSAARCEASATAAGIGHATRDRHPHARVRAVGHHRLERVAVDDDRAVVGRARVAGETPPRGHGGLPGRALRRERPAVEVLEGRLVRARPARPGLPPSIDMLQTVIRSSIERARMAGPVYSNSARCRRRSPIFAMRARMMSLAVDAGGEAALHADLERLRLALEQALRGEDMLDLARADPEGEGAEGPVGGRVAVAADDGHARLGQPQLRPDDVDDPLAVRAEAEERDAELRGVAPELLDLEGGLRVDDRQVPRRGGRRVIRRGHRLDPVGAPRARGRAAR